MVAAAAAALLACAPRNAQPPLGPIVPALEREAIAATAPDRPLRLLFDWSIREADARFSGRGVARLQPPYRARLDLFGPRDEAYLVAALVEDEIRLPAGAQRRAVPPPPMLWSVLGVFTPPAGAELVGASRDGDRVRLEYLDARNRWRFGLEAGRLRSAEWLDQRSGRHTVELRYGAENGSPASAVYREWTAFRELVLTLDRADEVESFPPDTWIPGAL